MGGVRVGQEEESVREGGGGLLGLGPLLKSLLFLLFIIIFCGITLNFLLLTHLNRFGSLGCIGSAFIYFTQIQALDNENRFTNRDEYELKAK